MNALDLAKEYFPEESEEFLEDIIWSETAFPFTTNPTHLREQIAGAKFALDTCAKLLSVVVEENYYDAQDTNDSV